MPVHKITYQGDYLKWQYPEYHRRGRPTEKRGEVTHFSEASRFRMLCLMNKIDWTRIGKSVFITLTYPNFCRPNCNDEINVHRALMARYIENRMQRNVSILWRTEWQWRKEGAMRHFLYPHIHLIAFNVTYIHYAMVNRWWRTIIGYNTDEHLQTETKRAYDQRSCFGYLSGYLGKLDSLVIGAYLNNSFGGRQWGMLRRNDLPMSTEHYAEIPDSQQLTEIWGELVGDSPRNEYGNKSFTLLRGKGREAGNAIFGMTIDGELHDV